MAKTTKTTTAKKQPIFIVKGKTYLAEPTMEEFIKEAEVAPSTRTGAKNALKSAGIEAVEILFTMTEQALAEIDNIGKGTAKKRYIHSGRVKRKGDFISEFS